MSTTGPISNYYVDSLINHENEDVLAATRFSAPGSHPAGPRPTSLVPECADYPSCSFAPKAPVFSTSWAPVHSQSSVVYHPYSHQPHLGTDSRYMRSWLEPISGAVPFHGYPGNSRHYGLKPDAFQEHRAGECLGSSGRTYTDYLYCSSTDMRDKTHQNIPSPESELLASGKHKDEKPELDPSKFKLLHSFTAGWEFLLWNCVKLLLLKLILTPCLKGNYKLFHAPFSAQLWVASDRGKAALGTIKDKRY